MSDGSANFLGSLVGSTASRCARDAEKHINSSDSCWTRPSSTTSTAGRPWKTLIIAAASVGRSIRHPPARRPAYYRSLMRRPMRLNLSSRCNKGATRNKSNERKWSPTRRAVAAVKGCCYRSRSSSKRKNAAAARPRSATGRDRRLRRRRREMP